MGSIDYLSLRPINIDTPTVTYRRYWFLYDRGVGRVQTNGHSILTEAAGTLEQTADQEWTFTATESGDTWQVTRGGCACGGSKIIPKST